MAAYAGIDTFNSYSSGTGLNSLSGGSGWSGAWTAGSHFVTNNATVLTTGNSVQFSGAANTEETASRTLSASASSGDLYFAIYETAHTADGFCLLQINSGATIGAQIGFIQNGTIISQDAGGNNTLVATATDATWYVINVNFLSTTTFRTRWKIKGGAWSSFTSTLTFKNSVSSPDTLKWDASKEAGATVFYFDDIQLTDPDVPASLAPFNKPILQAVKRASTY